MLIYFKRKTLPTQKDFSLGGSIPKSLMQTSLKAESTNQAFTAKLKQLFFLRTDLFPSLNTSTEAKLKELVSPSPE